jgi:hypothetical protein
MLDAMFDITMKTPTEIGVTVARGAALVFAAFAAVGLFSADRTFETIFAGAMMALFLVTAAAPVRLGPPVGGGVLFVAVFVCFLAPAGGMIFDPPRAALFVVIAPFALALTAPRFAAPVAALFRNT